MSEAAAAIRILLVEDEVHLRDAIKLNLEMEGYEVVAAGTGQAALQKHQAERFNLIILDVMLPEMSGLEICQQIRLTDFHTPVFFLTAKDSSRDKIAGLQTGADDYMTKPFNLEEFLLRVKVLVKHSIRGTEISTAMVTYQFGDNSVNFVTFEATGNRKGFTLTRKEAMLLKLLIDRKNKVVSRQEILQTVWGYDVYPTTRTIDNFILAFRKYFEKDPRAPRYFHSIRGVGYKFTDH